MHGNVFPEGRWRREVEWRKRGGRVKQKEGGWRGRGQNEGVEDIIRVEKPRCHAVTKKLCPTSTESKLYIYIYKTWRTFSFALLLSRLFRLSWCTGIDQGIGEIKEKWGKNKIAIFLPTLIFYASPAAKLLLVNLIIN